MSYLDKITSQQKSELIEVNDSLRTLYKQFIKDFYILLPQGDLSKAELILENKIFAADCDFTGIFKCSIEFKNCYFLNDTIFYDTKFEKKLSINHCFFDREIRITRNVQISSFDLILASIKGQLIVDGGIIKEGKWSMIDNCRVLINGGSFDNLDIGYWGGGSILRELSFHLPRVKGLIRVTGDKSKIERLDLFQFSPDVSISIEDVAVNSISIYRFRNEKSLRLSNIKAFETTTASQFSIVESYLGKSELYSINLRDFKSIHLVDSHLVDCSLVNILFPDSINAYKGRLVGKLASEEVLIEKIKLLEAGKLLKGTKRPKYDQSIITYYEKKKETLRQIKYALSKQGDSVNEQRFHSLEMKAHDRSLTCRRSFWTKLIIKASSWTSDFGQSVHKPLLWLLIGHFILFTIVLFCDKVQLLHLSINEPTWEGFWIGFHEYFKLINPLRRADETFAGGFIVIDLLMRIWASYMIYNIIRASRRFIK